MLLTTLWQILVGIDNKRKQNTSNENHLLLRGNKMKQARVLNEKELNLLLLYINTRRHSARDRLMVLMTFYAGMRIKEVVATRLKDVLANDGSVRLEINLSAEQTKGKYGRTVVLPEKLRKEIQNYLSERFTDKQLIALTYSNQLDKPLFATQKRAGFDANTACYHFHMLFKNAGLDGASSHSGRRSFITKLSAKSVPLKVLMEMVGHRNLQTTQRYIEVTPDQKRAAAELV
ncbi:XerC Integrase [Methylophilaceae bacterium]|jgi:integrase/recombinase XerD